jgi:hypothetical protein
MNPYFKQSALMAAAAVLMITGCSESKVSQCNKLIDVANQAAEASKEFGANPQPEKGGKAFTEMADKIDGFTNSLSLFPCTRRRVRVFGVEPLLLTRRMSRR